MAAASASASTHSLKEYLKRYENTNEDQKKKKKKKKETKGDAIGGVRVVDEDPVWQKPVKIDEEEDNDSADEEKPQIDEDVEVKRMKRLEEIRTRRPYLTISDDGSGWVPISDTSKRSNSGNEISDVSPPRQTQVPSPELNTLKSGSGWTDFSPPRQRRARFDTPSPEPEPKPSRNEIPDLSPPRQRYGRHHTSSPDPNPKPSNSANPGRDLSPPGRSRPQMESSGFKRKNLEKPDLRDLSPPRRSHPPPIVPSYFEKKNSEGTDSRDLSPSRRSRPPLIPSSDFERKNSEGTNSRDLSPPRLGRRRPREVDASCVSPVTDLSPPRKTKRDSSSTKEGRRAGLFSGQEMKEENDRKRKEDRSRFLEMDPLISGRGSEPVYREQGKPISKDEFLKLRRGEEKPKEKKLEWGKGLAQKREAEARELELELEKDKPFARTRDDPELDKMLKERVRWGDPMAHLVKKKDPELILEDLGDDEKMKESGFVIPQTIPSHSWMKRGIDAVGNRYGIRPGRHWDGVDRSNGYEKEMFKRQNEKRATEREAYLWSVSDM